VKSKRSVGSKATGSINIPNLGDFADPRRVADIARLAEEAGSDGLFVWDHLIGYNQELVGEFGATNILLGCRFGEPTNPKVLARLLDEGLEAITLLWSGEPVTFHGSYVAVDDVIMRPTPVQYPRVPIFVGGHWPHKAPARRTAHWDGALLTTGSWDQPPDHGVIAEMQSYIRAHRDQAGLGDQPFELVVGGSTSGDADTVRDMVGPLADAGATWWDERFPIDKLGKFDAVRTRTEQGPPQLD
jgi:alkanesulfonate monooxygenase SsuD/methylene tetrahydromethanopterin reductase-like flavin-dependent oxidoreductase (luciferase family)